MTMIYECISPLINLLEGKDYSRTSIIQTSIIRTLEYPNSTTDCFIRVFWLKVYVLLE